MINVANKALNVVSNLFGAVAMVFLAFLMFGITLDVAARAILGQSISGVFEMSELSLVMLVFFGAMWAQRDDSHIRVTLLPDRLRGGGRRFGNAIAWGGGALALLMFAWPATQEAIYSISIWEFRWGYVQMPIWWTKAGVAIGLWLAALQMAVYALLCLTVAEPRKA